VGDSEPCDRFTFLLGGATSSDEFEGGERAAARDACETGRWIPKLGSDNDFRRVLYGILNATTTFRASMAKSGESSRNVSAKAEKCGCRGAD
jgi:hypothetical protein